MRQSLPVPAPSHSKATPQAPAPSFSAAQWRIEEALRQYEHGLKIVIWSHLSSLLKLGRGAIESEWEDVMADVRERALRNAHRYDPEKSVNAWLSAIAFNCVRDLKRKKSREVLAHDAPLPQTTPHDQTFSEAEVFDVLQKFVTPARDSDALDLGELLTRVAPAYHQTLRLHIERGLVGQALAAQLGISEGAAAVKLCRAKAALLAAYQKSGGRDAPAGEVNRHE